MKATKHANGVKDLDAMRMPPPISTQRKAARHPNTLRKILTKLWNEKTVEYQVEMIKKKLIAAQRKAFMSSMAKHKKRKQRSNTGVGTKSKWQFLHTKRQLNV